MTVRTPVRRLMLAALAVALVSAFVTAAAPAGAATSWHLDPTGDVIHYDAATYGFVTSKTSWTDIRGVSGSYDKNSLRVGTSIRGYRHLDGNWAVDLTTSKRDSYHVETSLDVGPGDQDYVFLWKDARGSTPESVVKCDGLRIARTARGITATVPTKCISAPWRLKFAVTTGSNGPFGGDGKFCCADYGFQDGRQPAHEQGSKYSSWVRQG